MSAKAHFAIGTWIAKDGWVNSVVLTVSRRGPTFSVRAKDSTDGELAEIYDLKVTKTLMSFAAHWSTGRFTKYEIRPFGGGEVHVTFTHTETATYARRRRSRVS